MLFVCTANLCRSPMAEGALRSRLKDSGIDLDSAGTHDYGEGMPPHRLAIEAAARHGYDISRLSGRRVRPHDFHYFDAIVAMDRRNVADLRRACPEPLRGKIVRLMDFAPFCPNRDVRDPSAAGSGTSKRACAA